MVDRLQTEEYIECRKNPIYFMKKYGKIRHPQRGIIPFALWDFQESTLESFLENPYNIVLKGRQLGISTLVAGYAAWLSNFFKNKETYILATKRDTAQNMVDKVRVFLEGVPDWMKAGFETDNKQSLVLSNGSKIKASASTPDAARSEALSLLIIDEAAFINKMDAIWVAAQPTLATGGDCIALSSPNGVGNWFHKTYNEAEAGVTEKVGNKIVGFNTIRLHWSVHPDHDAEWARLTERKIGPQAFAQEHDCDFIQSGNNVVSLKALEWYNLHPTEDEQSDEGFRPFVREPEEKTWVDKNLWIWKYPNYEKKYIISADVARGDGEDYSGFHVIDIDSYEQVAEYKGKIATDVYAHLLHNTAVQYNNAFIVVENASMGHHVIMKIIEMEYKNIYWTVKDLAKLHDSNARDQLYYDPYNPPKNAVPGFTTSTRTRPAMIARLEEDLRLHEFILHSQRTMKELDTFIFHNGKPQSLEGYNDDLVMSLAIGMYVRNTTIRFTNADNNLTDHLMSNLSFNSTPYEYGITNQTRNEQNSTYTMTMPDGQVEDLRWLL
tara:strand:- start:3155 stop:4807 length:1653 start_codon:yes stop_codon:yes gene_type:complete